MGRPFMPSYPNTEMDGPVEPPACSAPFSAEAGGLHYLWRGKGPGERATTVGIYDPLTEQWTLQPTTGPPPPGVGYGGCASLENHFYCFGGYDGCSFFSDLHKLDLETFQWSKLHARNDPSEWPLCKTGSGVVTVNKKTLACFGGYCNAPTKPGSTFTRNTKLANGSGWTNELHLFDLQEGILSP